LLCIKSETKIKNNQYFTRMELWQSLPEPFQSWVK
jgi:hypothetical protein